MSDEHFTVDGTLIEAWASLKSVKPKAAAAPTVPPDDPSNPTVDFHGEHRTNATHQSTTDPDARLARKGPGKEATLCFSGHVLMENRHGLCVDLQIAPATGRAERDMALAMLRRQARRGIRPTTVGTDKGYHCRDLSTAYAAARSVPTSPRSLGGTRLGWMVAPRATPAIG